MAETSPEQTLLQHMHEMAGRCITWDYYKHSVTMTDQGVEHLCDKIANKLATGEIAQGMSWPEVRDAVWVAIIRIEEFEGRSTTKGHLNRFQWVVKGLERYYDIARNRP